MNINLLRESGGAGAPSDVRIIAATNRDMEREVNSGRFRMDLYYRLNIAELHMPSFSERKSDLPILIHFFIRKLNQRYHREVSGFSKEDLKAISRYLWPGNVRELRNTVESAFINSTRDRDAILTLPKSIRKEMNAKQIKNGGERQIIVSALIASNWNKAETARKINCSRMTIYRKMKKYNIVEKGI